MRIRCHLAVGEPDLDIGNLETALEALGNNCYFLEWEGNRYRFSVRANLNKLLADRRAALDSAQVEEKAREAIRKAFADKKGVATSIELVFFPEESSQIDDVPALRLVVLGPDRPVGGDARVFIERCMSERGASARVFKNALVWVAPDVTDTLMDASRRFLAWESLEHEADAREFEESQRKQLTQQKERARVDLTEAVWRTYRVLTFLGADGSIKEEDMGLMHSSAAESLQAFVQARLRQRDELTDTLAPSRILQNWPKGFAEWSVKGLRDAVYASPVFTRLLHPDGLKASVSRGIRDGLFGYATKSQDEYVGIMFEDDLDQGSVDFSDDAVLVSEGLARQLKDAKPTPEAPVPAGEPSKVVPEPTPTGKPEQPPIFGKKIAALKWIGEVPYQKWTSLYTKVLQRLVSEGGLTIRVEVESRPTDGLYEERLEETKQSLRELGLSEDISTENQPDES